MCVCRQSSLMCGLFATGGEQGLLSSCGAQASHCGGFSCCGALVLGSQASVFAAPGLQSSGSVVVVHGLSCPAACGHVVFPDQG